MCARLSARGRCRDSWVRLGVADDVQPVAAPVPILRQLESGSTKVRRRPACHPRDRRDPRRAGEAGQIETNARRSTSFRRRDSMTARGPELLQNKGVDRGCGRGQSAATRDRGASGGRYAQNLRSRRKPVARPQPLQRGAPLLESRLPPPPPQDVDLAGIEGSSSWRHSLVDDHLDPQARRFPGTMAAPLSPLTRLNRRRATALPCASRGIRQRARERGQCHPQKQGLGGGGWWGVVFRASRSRRAATGQNPPATTMASHLFGLLTSSNAPFRSARFGDDTWRNRTILRFTIRSQNRQ
jgi:hypothetical protein